VAGRLRDSVVWPGARVAPGEVLVGAIRTDRQTTVLIRGPQAGRRGGGG